jgi:gliding motility-associated-like protein
MYSRLLFIALLFAIPAQLIAQAGSDPYFPNGSAFKESCNCYTLTTAQTNQSGSVWNKIMINLNQSFDFKFNINLGSSDAGADGMVFGLQNINYNIGSTGEGLGFAGVKPSVGILIDTYQNGNQNDPSYDHISINRDGDVNHSSANNLAGPVSALDNSTNIEDGQWHVLRVTWDAATKKLSAQVDGVDRVSTTIDLVANVFSNDPMVYWGFTAATGGAYNLQKFCTSLNPGFSLAKDQLTCFPTPIQFKDSSASFGTILKWYWDFGDGKIDSVQVPDPHVYPAPGVYQVKLNIFGNNGCLSDTFKQRIIVGSKPVAAFSVDPTPVCEGDVAVFKDASTVEYGSITNWEWNVDNGQYVASNATNAFQRAFPLGPHTVALQVKTKEGCVSDPVSHPVPVSTPPSVALTVSDACFKEPVPFTGSSLNAGVNIRQWYWLPGDGTKDSTVSIDHIFNKGGDFTVRLYAQADNGCMSDTVQKTIHIYETHAFAGNDTVVADNYPFPMNGSGGPLYEWSPPDGLSNAHIANPVATIPKGISYVLTAYTPIGCATKDTINIKVFKGPAIYVPNSFSPNGDNRNDRFRVTAVGITEFSFLRIYNRYGQLVYNSSNPKEGWDGTINGKPQPSGVYVWMTRGKDFLGQLHEHKGAFTLVR